MKIENAQDERSCPGGCPSCSRAKSVPEGPSGWRLTLPAVGIFLAPLALAVVGAAVSGPGEAGRALGAVGGLVAGLGGAIVAGRLLGRKGRAAS